MGRDGDLEMLRASIILSRIYILVLAYTTLDFRHSTQWTTVCAEIPTFLLEDVELLVFALQYADS